MPPQPVSPHEPALTNPDRRTGKIALLPRSTRDQLNTMLLDGVPYADIISRLGPDARHLTERNLSAWKTGGYQDWLRELRLTDAIHAKYELAQSIIRTAPNNNTANQALLRVIATNPCHFLAEETIRIIQEQLELM